MQQEPAEVAATPWLAVGFEIGADTFPRWSVGTYESENYGLFPCSSVGTYTRTLLRSDRLHRKIMGRSRYRILEADKPHFLTCTVLEWLPVFTRPDAVQILLDSWLYQREHAGLQLFGYVILENHLHLIAQAPRLDNCLSSFKSFTAGQLIKLLQAKKAERLLQRLYLGKAAHKRDRQYQFWQEGSHAEMVFSDDVMREKLDYIHYNPVKRGYVDAPEHWRYSSARNYLGQPGLIEIDTWG